jgi:hypothetical protein
MKETLLYFTTWVQDSTFFRNNPKINFMNQFFILGEQCKKKKMQLNFIDVFVNLDVDILVIVQSKHDTTITSSMRMVIIA